MLLLVVALFGGHDSSIIHGESAPNLHGTYDSAGMVPKDGNEPPTRIVLGNPNVSVSTKQMG